MWIKCFHIISNLAKAESGYRYWIQLIKRLWQKRGVKLINDLFNNVNLLEKGLDASWTKNKVIANNIANNDTPGFKASHVEFESVFKKALKDDGGFRAKTTRPEHYDFSGASEDMSPVVSQRENVTYRSDGNSVDIDYENLELAKNTILYNELATQLRSEFNRLDTVINR
jgi:flagellar basal-body rod protein FlgB